MDHGWTEKVQRQAYCDGAAQETIVKLSPWDEPGEPVTFTLDPAVRAEFDALCRGRGYEPGSVLPQLVESFIRRLRLMQEGGRMSPEEQAAFHAEVQQDGRIMQRLIRGD